MQRTPTIIGNWKMHKTIQESAAFVKCLVALPLVKEVNVGLAVPFTALAALRDLHSPLRLGAQDVSEFPSGAYTGEISATMLREAGADFVLIGHSERRHLFHESSALVSRKVEQALEKSLAPLVCVGESAAERERGETEAVLKEQLTHSLQGLTATHVRQLTLAYEPVWAIGTGRVATAQQANEAHLFIRACVAQLWGKEAATQLPILYGGSVKPEHVTALMQQSEIDGLLVGGASLDPQMFHHIIVSAQGTT